LLNVFLLYDGLKSGKQISSAVGISSHLLEDLQIIFFLEFLLPGKSLLVPTPLLMKSPFKGTWQRGGFSGVFAEIGSA
jgi:hypothetical protein